MNEKGFSPVFIALIVVLIIGVGAGVYYFKTLKSTQFQNQVAPSPQPTSFSTPIPTSDSNQAEQKTTAQQTIPIPSSVVTSPSSLNKKIGYYNEQDGKVWVDVEHIVTLVNLYYSDTKRLPQSLNEISTLPDLSFAKSMPVNPFNNGPYIYVFNQDNSAFMVSGVMHDGVEYKITVPIQN